MIKRLMLMVLLGCFVLSIQAQKNENAVRSFAANMQSWSQTTKLEYRNNRLFLKSDSILYKMIVFRYLPSFSYRYENGTPSFNITKI